VAYLNLNPKDKIKIKGKQNSKEKQKGKGARFPPFPGLSAQAAHPRVRLGVRFFGSVRVGVSTPGGPWTDE
jgi:hypothetical protein